MPQQDRVVLINDERDHEAEGENAIGDLADLLLGMCPRVTWIGFERMRRNPLDLMHNEFLSRSGRGAQSHPGLAVVGLIFEELRLRSRAAGPRCGAAALGPLAT